MTPEEVTAYVTANKMLMNKVELENLVKHFGGPDGLVDMTAFLFALSNDTSGENPIYHQMYAPDSVHEGHLALSGKSHLEFGEQAKPVPYHWGVPPNAQMKGHDGIVRELPGGYGKGNAPMFNWVMANMKKDKKSHTNERGCKPYPYGNYSL